MAEKRAAWKQAQSTRPRGRLIFIDETWAKTNMTRLRGRAPIGRRLRAKVPHGHWKTTTLIAALCTGGINCSTVVDGAINADVFEAFVKRVLVPQLRPGVVAQEPVTLIMTLFASENRLSKCPVSWQIGRCRATCRANSS